MADPSFQITGFDLTLADLWNMQQMAACKSSHGVGFLVPTDLGLDADEVVALGGSSFSELFTGPAIRLLIRLLVR